MMAKRWRTWGESFPSGAGGMNGRRVVIRWLTEGLGRLKGAVMAVAVRNV